MKINNRYYLDFNASSPLANSVKEFLAKGDFFYGNPSSVHTSGKKSRRMVQDVSDYLKDFYSLPETYLCLFHSGATEGINTLLQGSAKHYFRADEKVQFLLGKMDHSCVVNQEEDLKDFGHEVLFYEPDHQGRINKEDLIEKIKSFQGHTILNYTWVNNETGVVSSLEAAEQIKKETGCTIIVDAVQSIGKIEDWNKVSHCIDAYTFSGHKFGSLKGIGWSFVNINLMFAPLLRGGGQQGGYRSGTENTDAIYSLKLAMQDLEKNQKQLPIKEFMDEFKKDLIQLMGDSIELIANDNQDRAQSTFYFILKKEKADISLIAFDLDNIDLSSGSACSSGALEPSRVLKSMGYDDLSAKSALRVSFPFYFNRSEYESMRDAVFKVVKRFK